MTGHSANTAPFAALSSARPAGICQTPIAMRKAAIRPASDACHAGRRSTPSITSTTAIGMAATTNDNGRLSATGVSNCLKILKVLPAALGLPDHCAPNHRAQRAAGIVARGYGVEPTNVARSTAFAIA